METVTYEEYESQFHRHAMAGDLAALMEDVRNGADPMSVNMDSETPLMVAVLSKKIRCVEFLSRISDSAAVSKDGITAFGMACILGYTDSAVVLLGLPGWDHIDPLGLDGESWAREEGYGDILAAIDSHRLWREWMDGGEAGVRLPQVSSSPKRI